MERAEIKRIKIGISISLNTRIRVSKKEFISNSRDRNVNDQRKENFSKPSISNMILADGES